MKREILFRAWDKVEGKYFEPIYEAYKGNLLDLSISLNGRILRRTIEIPAEDESCFQDRYILEQFTGLTDKNGVKIFEGDIVKWTFGKHYWEAIIQGVPNSQSINLYAMETFHNCTKDIELEEYTYERSDSRQGARNDITYLSPSVEITGNIHDNPELINK